ncbi:MAG: DeoR/GlpR transcriptional regulator [Ruminococcus sp.]|nr:DeoR/GlpR transcriptional regulator [Ruminococcus sp.]
MLTQERYQAILSIVNDRNAVTVAELAQMLSTSESTIRRDLNALDEIGKIRKVFGGATSVTQSVGMLEDNVSDREHLMYEEKTEIGKYAATLINDTDFVYIDSGTTTSRMIDFITDSKATFVTNGISHARKLIQKGLNAYIVGGKIKPLTEAVVGTVGIANLKSLNFSKAFMGTNGIDVNAGFTTPDLDEARIKEAAVKGAYMAFVLADHTKFRRVFSVTFASLRKCCILTDKMPDNRFSNTTVIKEVMK